MKYLFVQTSGNSTFMAILENILVKDGTVYATKVGQFSGWVDSEAVYEACEPVQFIAGGGPWHMSEYKEELLNA